MVIKKIIRAFIILAVLPLAESRAQQPAAATPVLNTKSVASPKAADLTQLKLLLEKMQADKSCALLKPKDFEEIQGLILRSERNQSNGYGDPACDQSISSALSLINRFYSEYQQ